MDFDNISADFEDVGKNTGAFYDKAIAFFLKKDPEYVKDHETFDGDKNYLVAQRYERIMRCGSIVRKVWINGKLYTVRHYCHDKACNACQKHKIKKEISSICEKAEEFEADEVYELTVNASGTKYDTVRKQIERAGGKILKRIPQPNETFVIYATEKPKESIIVSERRIKTSTLPLDVTPEMMQEVLSKVPEKERVTGAKKKGDNQKPKPQTEKITLTIANIIFENEEGVKEEDIAKAWLGTEKLVQIDPDTMTAETYKNFLSKRTNTFCKFCERLGYKPYIAFYEPISTSLETARDEIRKANSMTDQETVADILAQERKAKRIKQT